MQVGRMRYRIEIQDYKSTQDAAGFETREWMTVHTVWADIAPVSGKEYMASNRETAEITNKIYIRFRSGIKSTMRIKHGDRIFEIESVLGDKRSGMLTIMAREVELLQILHSNCRKKPYERWKHWAAIMMQSQVRYWKKG